MSFMAQLRPYAAEDANRTSQILHLVQQITLELPFLIEDVLQLEAVVACLMKFELCSSAVIFKTLDLLLVPA